MNRKMYWGVAILILLIGTAAVFIIQHELADHRQLAEESADLEALKNRIKEENDVKDNPLSDAPVPNLDPTDPIELLPVEAPPQVTEVSNDTETSTDTIIDKNWIREFYSRYSPSDFERIKKSDIKLYEMLKESIPGLEKSLKGYSEYLQRDPDSKYYRQMYERTSRRLYDKRRQFEHQKMVMEVLDEIQ